MKLTKILTVTVLALNFLVACSAVTKSLPTAGYESARRILGNDFIEPYEAAIIHSIFYAYKRDQLINFERTLPRESILRWAKENNYAVIPGPPTPMSLLDVRWLKPELFWSQTHGWYADEGFAKNDKVTANWLIIRKEPVPNSVDRNWNEQLKLLAKNEQVPNAGEMSWFITTFYEVRGVRLFEKVYVRISSVTSGGDRVVIGAFGGGGLGVSDSWDDGHSDNVGVATSRKF